VGHAGRFDGREESSEGADGEGGGDAADPGLSLPHLGLVGDTYTILTQALGI
jgi:hypothetical protein